MIEVTANMSLLYITKVIVVKKKKIITIYCDISYCHHIYIQYAESPRLLPLLYKIFTYHFDKLLPMNQSSHFFCHTISYNLHINFKEKRCTKWTELFYGFLFFLFLVWINCLNFSSEVNCLTCILVFFQNNSCKMLLVSV